MTGKFNWGLPAAASTYAGQIDFGIGVIHWAMLLIFVLWGVFFTYLLIRYRRREGVPARREGDHGLWGLAPDIIVMLFEIALIAFYAVPVWSKIKMEFPDEAASMRVDVIAEQFAWNAVYPGPDGKFGRRDLKLVTFGNPVGLDRDDAAAADDVVVANELRLPTGKPALINLTSKDVIHSFFVPEFRIKQDAVPGMMLPVWVEPTLPGTYDISCAQLCGFAHSFMRGDAIVETPEDFERWLKARSSQALAAAPAKGADSW